MILGIDLGTTNSLIAYYDENGAHIIPNRLGEPLTPSVVSLSDEGEIYVGKIASERLITHPERTVATFKRSMGSAKAFTLGGKRVFTGRTVFFHYPKPIRDAQEYLKEEITEAVISVPAYFNDVQRKATQRAGELAGIKVERLINEPTAASIAYGLQEKNDQTKFLVVDLGGGTFDVSILELYQNIMEVRGVAGDNYLGGEDFTLALEKMFLEHFNLKEENLTRKEKALLRKQAETTKTQIGADNITMQCRISGEEYQMDISDMQFEDYCKPLLTRLRKPIERALNDASIKISEIDNIVLVGGATKLPLVKRFVSRLFKKFPSSHINPDEVVALGASMQAAMKERNEHIKEMILTDVCPYTLGTDIAISREGGHYEGGHFLPIIERNTIIPVSKTERLFTLHDQQRMIRIQILQGESRFSKNNIMLGEINIPVPMGPKGKEAVDVRYTYDINSILEVEVTVVSTGNKKRMVIEQNPGYMSKEEVEARLKELDTIKIHPRDQEENKLLIAKAERMYEENVGEARQFIDACLKQFEEVLDKQNPLEVKKAVSILQEQLKA